VQVAHSVCIGDNSVIASQVGISGSSKLGKRVLLGGQVGIADHCTLEDGSIVGAQSGIATGKTVRQGQTVWGSPARPLDQAKKQFASVARIPALTARVRKLEEGQRE
jgi:UDP-3-O-[3-hydroxymyristoyl] glucosamine N-acyltransferase